ncbi:hypothetical protein B0H14DRAFT_3422941 [Mycena olivaceomarginata]|nr:hypothetical protein B0H14DRAFT_3422941 [Mycena olivaceomarginata]
MTSFPPVAPGAEASSSAPLNLPPPFSTTWFWPWALAHKLLPREAPLLCLLPSLLPPPGTAAAAGFQTHGPWVAGALYLVVPTGPLVAVAEPPVAEGEEPFWYCVTCGKHVGLTINNALAMAAVVGVSRSSMKSYKTQALTLAAFNKMLTYNLVQVLP